MLLKAKEGVRIKSGPVPWALSNGDDSLANLNLSRLSAASVALVQVFNAHLILFPTGTSFNIQTALK